MVYAKRPGLCGLAISVAVLLLAGCTKINPQYCEQASDCRSFSCNVEARSCNDVQECTDSATCSAPTAPICDQDLGYCVPCSTGGPSTECEGHDPLRGFCSDDGECVECLDDEGCSGTSPICDTSVFECAACETATDCEGLQIGADICAPTGACVACLTHDDCSSTSEVCARDTNTCADPADVFYVDGMNGMDVGACGTKTNPCLTIEFGLAIVGNKPYLRVRGGSYTGNLVIDNTTIFIVAPGVTLISSQSDDPVLEVNNGATVSVDGMTLRGANGSGDPVGVFCRNSNTTVNLFNVRVTQNEASGVDSVGCTVLVEGGSVDSNSALGVAAINSVVTLTGVEIYGNSEGGVHVLSSEYDITNSFIVENGRAGAGGSDIGGVRADNAAETRPQRLAFNTVAGNNARTAANSSGVHCDTSGMATPVISSNLIYGNVGGGSQASGNCPYRYSNIEGFAGAGTDNNIDMDPLFDDVLDRNYHIRAGSPCENSGETLSDILFDFDIERRGVDAGYDIGADELD